MKRRMLVSTLLAMGLMVIGITNASAHAYCNLDPTYNIGLPVHYSINVHVKTGLVSADVYASGTSRTTTFGGGLGVL
jgi:hypothetical protein